MVEWRDVKDWEGYYEVSDTGEIYSVRRKTLGVDGKQYTRGGHILKPNHWGQVMFYREEEKSAYFVAELVLTAFLRAGKIRERFGYVDKDRKNRRLENLFWAEKKARKLKPQGESGRTRISGIPPASGLCGSR